MIGRFANRPYNSGGRLDHRDIRFGGGEIPFGFAPLGSARGRQDKPSTSPRQVPPCAPRAEFTPSFHSGQALSEANGLLGNSIRMFATGARFPPEAGKPLSLGSIGMTVRWAGARSSALQCRRQSAFVGGCCASLVKCRRPAG